MRTLLALLVAVVLALPAAAQAPGWQAYPAYNEVTALTATPDGLWAATAGGLFFYDVGTGELATVTSAGDLRGGPIGALTYDAGRDVVWIGYQDGVLERLDAQTFEVTAFFDVQRADQYASRGIRRVVVAGERLYLATDFGVVVFDGDAGRTVEAYARIGDLEAGTPVNDVLAAPLADGSDGLYVATAGGAYAARLGGVLQAPGAWARLGLDGGAFSLALVDGDLYVGGGPDGARDLYRRTASGFERRLFTNNPIVDLVPGDGVLYALAPGFVYALPPSGPSSFYRVAGASSLSGLALGPDGAPWAADAAVGLFRLTPTPAPGENNVTPETVAPPGPLSTAITDLDIGEDGVLWLVTERLASAGYASVSRFEDGTWTSYRTDDGSLDIVRSSLLSAAVAPDGAFFAGSGGGGLSVFRDGTPTTYTEANSSLEAALGAPGFVVVRDVAFDDDDRAWVLNSSGVPLHVFADGEWTGLQYPPGIPATAEPFRVAIDEFGQKWIALGGNGLGAWDTGADPRSGADDRAVRYSGVTGGGTGLPDADVRDVVVDRQGRVWIGTARGIAFVFSPGSAFAADPALATPQWPVIADGRDYLLRDVEVFDLEVDPAGQLWVGTSSGAYLLNAAGDELVRTVNAENSPLPSDPVYRIAVDPSTGRVFFVTDEGLFSAPGDATRPVVGSSALVTAPSPFRPATAAEGVVVSGLPSAVSRVRVATVAGDVVFAGEVRGGSFRWDGRDASGQLVPSGVYLVAAAGSDGSTTVGKIAVIR
ncbi:two-component regulator propeller domain-containing protein [Rubrivirga sp. IMCC45206]|uniref:type IX secretion system anionic LPS delivery protein PorZ n=1 Tax=Rubrivirga sp. IMCC45206 TaxID=3391614 RepID=UPI00398FC102